MPKQNNKNKMIDGLKKKSVFIKWIFNFYIYSVNVYHVDDINMVKKS